MTNESPESKLDLTDFVLCRRSRHVLPRLLVEPALEDWLQAAWRADREEERGEEDEDEDEEWDPGEYDTDDWLGLQLSKLSRPLLDVPKLLRARQDGGVTFEVDGDPREATLWRVREVGLVAYENADMWGAGHHNLIAVAADKRMSDAALAKALGLTLVRDAASALRDNRTGLIDSHTERLTLDQLRRK